MHCALRLFLPPYPSYGGARGTVPCAGRSLPSCSAPVLVVFAAPVPCASCLLPLCSAFIRGHGGCYEGHA